MLAAVVEAEAIEPSEDEVLEALEEAAPRERHERRRSCSSGCGRPAGSTRFKADLAQRKALDLLAESATPITVEQAQARDKLWTPGADAESARAALDTRVLTPV